MRAVETVRLPAATAAGADCVLSCVVGTYNRAGRLLALLDSVARGARCRYEIIVVDGGSTDGTIELMQSRPEVTPVYQQGKVGVGRSYNEGFRRARGKYVCYLADDIEVAEGALDQAVDILERQPAIGMVGLKMKDMLGPWTKALYMGGLSELGILNCNHGLLPTQLLKSLGYFSEEYHSFLEDVDLTAKVLCAGRQVVLTRMISVFHYREWAESGDQAEMDRRMTLRREGHKLYREKFRFLAPPPTARAPARARLLGRLVETLYRQRPPNFLWLGHNLRDWQNLAGGRFINPANELIGPKRPYHLVQKIPARLLHSDENPYRHLLNSHSRESHRSDLAAAAGASHSEERLG